MDSATNNANLEGEPKQWSEVFELFNKEKETKEMKDEENDYQVVETGNGEND